MMSWWSTTSMAALLNTLDKFYKSGTPTAPVLASATKHADGIYVAGTTTGGRAHIKTPTLASACTS